MPWPRVADHADHYDCQPAPTRANRRSAVRPPSLQAFYSPCFLAFTTRFSSRARSRSSPLCDRQTLTVDSSATSTRCGALRDHTALHRILVCMHPQQRTFAAQIDTVGGGSVLLRHSKLAQTIGARASVLRNHQV